MEARTLKRKTKRDLAREATRGKVVAAAGKLFCENGYDRVRVRDIAKAVGMSTGAIFANFTGKAALYEAATGQNAPDVVAFLDRLAGTSAPMAAEAAALRRQLVGVGPEAEG